LDTRRVPLTGAGEDLKGDLDGGPPLRLRALRTMLGYRDCRTSNLTKVMSNSRSQQSSGPRSLRTAMVDPVADPSACIPIGAPCWLMLKHAYGARTASAARSTLY
jgi:hypothetical protein